MGKIARLGGAEAPEPAAILPTRTTSGEATAWAKSPEAMSPDRARGNAILRRVGEDVATLTPHRSGLQFPASGSSRGGSFQVAYR